MRIKLKLFLLFMLIGVTPTLIAGYSIYNISRSSWEYDKLNDLMDVVDSKYIHVLDFLHMKKGDVKAIGRDELIHVHLQNYYAGVEPEKHIELLKFYASNIRRGSLLEEHAQEEEEEAGTDLSQVFGRDVKWDMYRLDERIHRYDEVLILDDNGKVIASSRKESIGMDLSADEFFIRGKKGVFIKDVYRDYTGKVVFGFAAPITESERHTLAHEIPEKLEKQFLGVIVLKVPIEYLNDIATGDLGNQVGGKLFFAGRDPSEDYYIVRGDGMMITQPTSLNGKEDVILKKEINTTPVQRCVIGGEVVPGNSRVVTKPGGRIREAQEISVNYEGVPVGVASMCIFEMNWTVIGEQHVDKIFSFKDVGTIQDITLGIIAVIIFISLLSAYYFYEHIITDPIEELIKGTEKIKKGDFDVRIKTKSRDEMGDLSDSFNKMAEDLKANMEEIEKAKENLEKEVETRKLAERQVRMLTSRLETIIRKQYKELEKKSKGRKKD